VCLLDHAAVDDRPDGCLPVPATRHQPLESTPDRAPYTMTFIAFIRTPAVLTIITQDAFEHPLEIRSNMYLCPPTPKVLAIDVTDRFRSSFCSVRLIAPALSWLRCLQTIPRKSMASLGANRPTSLETF
jgi:hypothetical protein